MPVQWHKPATASNQVAWLAYDHRYGRMLAKFNFVREAQS